VRAETITAAIKTAMKISAAPMANQAGREKSDAWRFRLKVRRYPACPQIPPSAVRIRANTTDELVRARRLAGWIARSNSAWPSTTATAVAAISSVIPATRDQAEATGVRYGLVKPPSTPLRASKHRHFRFWSNHRLPAYSPAPDATAPSTTAVPRPTFAPSHQPAHPARKAPIQPITPRTTRSSSRLRSCGYPARRRHSCIRVEQSRS